MHKIQKRYKELMLEYSFIKLDTDEYLDDGFVFEDEVEDEFDFDEMDFDEPEEEETEEIDVPEEGGDLNPDEMGVEPMPELEDQTGEVELEDGEIEIDITDLVDSTEQAKAIADATNKKLDTLLGQITQVIDNNKSVEELSNKISELEGEIIKRNPSSVEKLEMQSLHSAPYNVKIGDYWKDKVDYISDISGNNHMGFDDLENQEPREIVITSDDIDSSYSEHEVKNSFDDYEEEIIDKY